VFAPFLRQISRAQNRFRGMPVGEFIARDVGLLFVDLPLNTRLAAT
jgi:hypothetical protein